MIILVWGSICHFENWNIVFWVDEVFKLKPKWKREENIGYLCSYTEHKGEDLIPILAIQITPHFSECSNNIYIETIDGGFRQAIPPLWITIFWQQDTIYYAAHTIFHTNLSHLTGRRSYGENNLSKMNDKLKMRSPDVYLVFLLLF